METQNRKINHAIIPAAGWGTRFLPETKALPKEMLPIVDKPVIQFVVEEIVSAGIKNIAIITGWHKRAIEDHFDRSLELEKHLETKGKTKELAEIRAIAEMANFVYVRQKGDRYGNAMAILAAESAIKNESFVVVWGDEFIWARPTRLQQMMKVYEKHGGIVISAVKIADKNALSRYGVADAEKIDDRTYKIKKIVEKPKPDQAPSDLAMIGAYILPPEIFDAIKELNPGAGEEYQLVDAINNLIAKGFPAYACEIENGKYYDTGNKTEYLKTVVEFALQNPDYAEFRQFLKDLKL